MIVEGFIIGLHKSPFHGFSVEFSQHRPYNPGDSLKYIDWKIFGRTDRFYIKQFEEETNLKATILLDVSNSMSYSSGKISKLEYGKYLAASLTYMMLMQRDAVGMTLFDSKIKQYLPPRSVTSYLQPILKQLEIIQPGADTDISQVLHEIADRIKRRGLIILISDLLDEPEKVLSSLRHFRHNKHEVLLFHILDPLELSFKFEGDIQFEDLESGENIRTFPWYIQNEYKNEINEFINYYKKNCLENRIDYQLVETSTSFDNALIEYLVKRKLLN
ncbi:MAG: DUF58 domain-containing protein [Calditrichia bacterium]|nr:DUF58 domain-containing protein [Calditrichia bacterium]